MRAARRLKVCRLPRASLNINRRRSLTLVNISQILIAKVHRPPFRGHRHPAFIMHWLQATWKNLSLAQQFALTAIAIILPGALFLGWWISDKISEAVVKSTAEAALISMDGLLAPHVAEIRQTGALDPASITRLDNFLEKARAEERIVSVKVWRPDGTIIYSTFKDAIGKQFPLSESFQKALAGELGASFDEEAHLEDVSERATGKRLLEVYAPIRDPDTHLTVAVSEIYAVGDGLAADVARASRLTWFAAATATALLIGGLSTIVSRGSQTIIRQKQELLGKVTELQNLLGQNLDLQSRLRKANENVSEINEHVLQRVGADLHDGPAQFLAYALMRTSKIQKLLDHSSIDSSELSNMKKVLSDALREVRNLSNGLSLPELKDGDLAKTVEMAVEAYTQYTNKPVKLKIDLRGTYRNEALKVCAYRFVQEALNNSFKHAGGMGQSVSVDDATGVRLRVADMGPGLARDHYTPANGGLGLRGMRSRIEALGGFLTIEEGADGGVALEARFGKDHGEAQRWQS
jgi:signal transduction histidine kinase